jgi:hypothetical protein
MIARGLPLAALGCPGYPNENRREAATRRQPAAYWLERVTIVVLWVRNALRQLFD